MDTQQQVDINAMSQTKKIVLFSLLGLLAVACILGTFVPEARTFITEYLKVLSNVFSSSVTVLK